MQTLQVVQEYERAVIFRLGRLRLGGAKVRERNKGSHVNYLLTGTRTLLPHPLHRLIHPY